jgi:hypothetical protein
VLAEETRSGGGWPRGLDAELAQERASWHCRTHSSNENKARNEAGMKIYALVGKAQEVVVTAEISLRFVLSQSCVTMHATSDLAFPGSGARLEG